MPRLLWNEQIIVHKFAQTIVDGIVQYTLTHVVQCDACIQPVDLSEFTAEAADRINLYVAGNSTKSYKKLYTKTELDLQDVVYYNNTKYKLMRLNDYSKFVDKASHYRYVMISMED